MERSRYDELHDRYEEILTNKSGTRYERLVAMVFKSLEEQNTVIHDISLCGDSTAKHQIDVTIEKSGIPHRVLIECKDFDISGNNVGLPIVRNFFGAVNDINPDEAYIITSNGFTRDAMKYAKYNGIKLVILRKIEERDMHGRILNFNINYILQYVDNMEVVAMCVREEDEERFKRIIYTMGLTTGIRSDDPVFFCKGDECIQFNEFLLNKANDQIPPATRNPKTISLRIENDSWELHFGKSDAISFEYIDIKYDVKIDIEQDSINSKRIAELILSGFNGNDIIIFDDQIKRYKIDPHSGEVIKSSIS